MMKQIIGLHLIKKQYVIDLQIYKFELKDTSEKETIKLILDNIAYSDFISYK